jgi:glucuronate isomerase
MHFLDDDFLLSTQAARRLYHDFAAPEPIFDYHCHLSPKDIAENRRFNNLHEIWLEGDHYKWRAMRANGVPERFITGDAAPKEKFAAWAGTVPQTLRNPLYHWTHLELRRYFGIRELLDEKSAERVWQMAGEHLALPELTTQGIMRKFHVATVCTTDDPADDLAHHIAVAVSGLQTRILPAFRPDAAFNVHRPEAWNAWLARLEQAASLEVCTLADLLTALDRRAAFFHDHGCRLSDHGLDRCGAEMATENEAAALFTAARAGRAGRAAGAEEQVKFTAFVMQFLGQLYAEKGWTMQLHLGALRNNNTRLLRTLGPDTGFDSIGDDPQARGLSAFLNRLDEADRLPRTIVYNLNPADNYALAAMTGNFQDGTIPGKVQFGSGWWFLDQKEGMEWQINALSNLGLLSRFVGMVTDSRSFMSYPRHEYFRRVLCNLVGRDVTNGELPDDNDLLGPLIRNVCYGNARDYFGFETHAKTARTPAA